MLETIQITADRSLYDQISLLSKSTHSKIHLKIPRILTEDELAELCTFLIIGSHPFFLTKLSLQVDINTLRNNQFLGMLKELSNTPIEEVKLVFSEQKDSGYLEVISILTTIAPQISYPLRGHPFDAGDLDPCSDERELALKELQNIIIGNIQRRNENPDGHAIAHKAASTLQRDLDPPGAMGKKIKLKEIIKRGQIQNENLTHYVPIEIQHVETVEHEIVQQYSEVVEVQSNLEVHELQEYNGQLIDFQEFSSTIYKDKVRKSTGDDVLTESLYALLKQELFANLPHAIKYISPEAANQLARNLPRLVTLNKDNLPDGFILDQTQLGELVLNYDEHLGNEQSDPFTPTKSEVKFKSIYNIELKEQDIKSCIADDQLFETLCLSNSLYAAPKQLTNMWIQHNNKGIALFFDRLKAATESQPNLAHFLLENYLIHLPQWDHLYSNESFFSYLKRISRYDEQKFICLQSFLSNTGSSRHDLNKTVIAFEAFWNQLILLCAEQKVSVTKINGAKWITPKGGSPTVYMERILFILKQARSLKDQLKLEVSLENYGAYYASRFEGFKAVSTNMALDYDAEKQNKQPFNKNFTLYRVELEDIVKLCAQMRKYLLYNSPMLDSFPGKYWLVDATQFSQPFTATDLKNKDDGKLAKPFARGLFHPPYQLYGDTENKPGSIMKLLYTEEPFRIRKKDVYAASFRFIALQTSGITVSSLSEQFKKWSACITGNRSSELVATLFFTSHERFIKNHSLEILFNILRLVAMRQEFIESSINYLMKLYKSDIKFNQHEGSMLVCFIADMNTAEWCAFNFNIEKTIEKLFFQLKKNKFASLKLFDHRNKISARWPLNFALDTAELLSRDSMIDSFYRDDLLLFSRLINKSKEEVYCHEYFAGEPKEPAIKTKKEIVMANLEKVRYYLNQAATKEKPNNLHYAIQVILNAKNSFTYASFIDACTEIEKICAFDSKKVDEILHRHSFTLSIELPELFTKDNADLKGAMITLIMLLESTHHSCQKDKSERLEPLESANTELDALSFSELKIRLNELWEKSGTLLSITEKLALSKILRFTKEIAIRSAFGMPNAQGLLEVIAKKMEDLPDFQDYGDFEKVNRISTYAEKIANLFKEILRNSYVSEHEQAFIDLFKQLNFSAVNYSILHNILSLLASMPQRNYLSLLNILFANQSFIGKEQHFSKLCDILYTLNTHLLPSEYLVAFSRFVIANSDEEYSDLASKIVKIYENDTKDGILECILSHNLTYKQVTCILNLSEGIITHRSEISIFLIYLVQTQKLEPVIKKINDSAPDSSIKILEIISKSHALNQVGKTNQQPTNYLKIATLLTTLPSEELELLYAFYQTAPLSAKCLLEALQHRESDNFQDFLVKLEQAPFGKRDLENQFSCSEVERVINQSKDLMNGSPYSYQYRKQLMESFLFVNEIGKICPVYYNKPAINLTNAEIKSYFLELKAKRIPGLTPFKRRLLALGLMREAMGRSREAMGRSREFPYSTQIIALIDCIMHQGDFISNIDTGQGKSLIDTMKGALLWLDSDRVDLTTSSLVDAKRDIANYGPFLKLLGIPYSEIPIRSSFTKEALQKDGINFSTFAQLSLFYSLARVRGEQIDTPDTIISWVGNECDYTILDDSVIYRFAETDKYAISHNQEWIYYAINEFVTQPSFIGNDKATVDDDIADLKAYLQSKAKQLKKSEKIINKLSDAQYVSWLEAALVVNYILKVNEDYVIPDQVEKKVVNGREVSSKVVKILMKDKKVSPDSTFGKGIQQLLYAYLNKKHECTDFVIEPQNKTIISTNNKNLIDYYRAHKGFIWGSSGTVGSDAEIKELHKKYGFEFSKQEPHQKNRVKFNKPIVEANEQAQFRTLINQLITGHHRNNAPKLVFCEDINTATRLFNEIKKEPTENFTIQLYTGLGNEEKYINNAGKPNAITITTSALGRNTDIHYDKAIGLRVWHTFVDSLRGADQKSGRTGRQGSIGEVNYIFNAQKLGGKTIEQIRAEIDQRATLERNVNEELYNILGYLLSQIDALPNERFLQGKTVFLRKCWSQFSSDIEMRFRECRSDGKYDKSTFMADTLTYFNRLLATEVTNPPEQTLDMLKKAIEQEYSPKEKYNSCNDEVTIKDCFSCVATAYHPLENAPGAATEAIEVTPKAIKDKLTQLFDQITQRTFVAKNSDYLNYLSSNSITQNTIVEAHKEFLTQYLQAHSQKLNAIQRWLSYEGKLSQITSNQNYLLIFYAFASISDQPIVELNVMRQAINTLLDEYLENSWFISSDRKKWVADVKNQVSKAEDIGAVICCLSQAQVATARHDININKGRILKPLHFFGYSRYQTTLNRALNLVASLSAKTEIDGTTNELSQLMTEVTDNVPIADLNWNELKLKATSIKNDKRNASVIMEALANRIAIKNRREPVGMSGRVRPGSALPENIKPQEEKGPNCTV